MIKNINDIINDPLFNDFQKYINILAETGEFSNAIVDIEQNIIESLEDYKISNYEMQFIAIKAFNIIKLLYDKKFKFKKLDSNNSKKIKDLLRNDMKKLLLFIISNILNKIKEKYPELTIDCDLQLIINTIVNTAELTLNLSKKSKFYKYICCCCSE